MDKMEKVKIQLKVKHDQNTGKCLKNKNILKVQFTANTLLLTMNKIKRLENNPDYNSFR